MKNLVFKAVKDFLSTHWKEGSPVLFAFSGGVDSSALFTLLLECRYFFLLDLRVVHFDHAWREESLKEAALLKELVSQYEIPFYTERSQLGCLDGSNLEEKARNERYLFFQKIYRQVGAQALLLAHQREDQVETVLKRLFEGSGLFSISGMRESSLFEEMTLWRPLLSISREDLEKWNEKKGCVWRPFRDRTNFDLKFLRPRMREQLFPELEKQFGKGIRQNLFRVGEEIASLKKSMMKRLEPYLQQAVEGRFGSALPVMGFSELDSFERQELVRFFLNARDVVVASSILKTIVSLLESEVSHKKIEVSKGVLLLERGLLVWVRVELPSFEGRVPLKESSSCFAQGAWRWEISKSAFDSVQKQPFSLRFFLEGVMSYYSLDLPGLELSSYSELSEKDQKKISGYLSKNKIPATLKRMFPFLTKNRVLVDCFFNNHNDFETKCSIVLSSIILKM